MGIILKNLFLNEDYTEKYALNEDYTEKYDF